MKNLFSILLLFSLGALFSCKQKEDDAAIPNEYAAEFVRNLNTSDTFRLDFPFYYSARSKAIDSSSYYSKVNSERWLALASLEKGFDSIQIRVSYGCALMSEWMMIILTHDKRKWIAEVLRIKNHFNDEKETVDSMSRKSRFDTPKSGWKAFITRLFRLNILSIEDDRIVIPKNDYPAQADGCGLGVEIATKNVFRFYTAGDPAWHPEKYWQSASINDMKKLLLEEFEVLKSWDEQLQTEWHADIKKNLQSTGSNNKAEDEIKVQEIIIQDVVDTPAIKMKKGN